MDIDQTEHQITSPTYKADLPSLVLGFLTELSDPRNISKISNFQDREYTKKIFNTEIDNFPRNVIKYISRFSHLITRCDKLSFTQFAIKYFDHYESQGVNISPENSLKIFKILSAQLYSDNMCLDVERLLSSFDKNVRESFFSLISEGYTEMAPMIEMLFKFKEASCNGLKDSALCFVEQCSDFLIKSLMLTNSQSETTYKNSLSCAVYLATRLSSSFGECLLHKTKDWAPCDDLDCYPKIRSITEERAIFARRMLELSEITPRSSLKLNIQMVSSSENYSLENILMRLVTSQFQKCTLEKSETCPASKESILIQSIFRHSAALPTQTLMNLLIWDNLEHETIDVPKEFIEDFVINIFRKNFNAFDEFQLTKIIQSSCSIKRKLLLIKLYVGKMNDEDSIESLLGDLIKECDLSVLPSITEVSLSLLSESRIHGGLFVLLVDKFNNFLQSLRSKFIINPSEINSDPSMQSISRIIRNIHGKLSDPDEKSKSIKREYVSLIGMSGFLELIKSVCELPSRNDISDIGEIFVECFNLANQHEPLVQDKIVEILFDMATQPTEIGRRALNIIDRISFSQYANRKNNILGEKIIHSLKNFNLITQERVPSQEEYKTSLHASTWLETFSFLMISGRSSSMVLNCPQILNFILELREHCALDSTDQIEKLIERIKHSSLGITQWYEASIYECCDKFLQAGDVHSTKVWFSKLTFLTDNSKININSFITDGLEKGICGILHGKENKNLTLLSAKVQYVLSHLHDSKDFMSHFHESSLSETIRNLILPIPAGDGKMFYEAYDIIPWREFFPSEYFKIE